MTKETVNYEDLCKFGFKPHQARDIIREAKALMVQKGYSFYQNKRLGVVPKYIVSDITGISFNEEEKVNVKD